MVVLGRRPHVESGSGRACKTLTVVRHRSNASEVFFASCASVASVAAGAERIRRLNPALPLDEAMRLASRVLLPAPDGSLQWRWDPMHRTRAAVAFDLDRFLLLLRQVACPTALLFGKQSWYLQLPDLEERISCIADVQINTLLDTGHSPHMEAPDLLAETLQAALSGAVR